ncbi:hypothetical protein ACOMHN_036017 [Nucella lapillus]
MYRHRAKCEGSCVLVCPVCGKTFHRTDKYKEHLFNRHQEGTWSGALFACPRCGKQFGSRRALARHRKLCEDFDDSVTLLEHLPRAPQTFGADPSLPNVCRNCGKRYKLADSMLRHRKKCEGVFNYACSVCGKMYYRRDAYREHLFTRHGMVEPDMKHK